MSASLFTLPPEILLCITDYIHKPAFNSLVQTCTYIYSVLNEYLYRLEARTRGIGLIWATFHGEVGAVKKLLDAGVLARGM